jgi:tetratricopeptide (TPR) repeat protein
LLPSDANPHLLLYQRLSRAAVLIIFVACLKAIGCVAAKAQQGDDIDTLSQQVVPLMVAGKYAEAAEIAKRVLDLTERQFGSNHTNVAAWTSTLANLYRAQNRYAEAEPLYKRALAIDENVLGPDHPHVARALLNFASLYLDQGRYADGVMLTRLPR